MPEAILEVKDLHFSYEVGKETLKGISFSVPKGSYACVIGHNGSGKSTLAKCIMGLNSTFKGDVLLFGEKLSPSSVYRLRSRIGIVFQNPDNQFVGSTVADDIAFGLENTQVPTEQMEEIIHSFARQVGMEDFLEHEPQMLSGGQKQRVAISGVLAMKPSLIIFDEATAMLDPKGKKEIYALVERMRQENPDLTLLSITHDVEEAANADQVIVINDGNIVYSGTPKEVFSHEKELKEISLHVPFFFALKRRLEDRGLEIPEDVDSLPLLEDYLCR